jgi:hypothetical protein
MKNKIIYKYRMSFTISTQLLVQVLVLVQAKYKPIKLIEFAFSIKIIYFKVDSQKKI